MVPPKRRPSHRDIGSQFFLALRFDLHNLDDHIHEFLALLLRAHVLGLVPRPCPRLSAMDSQKLCSSTPEETRPRPHPTDSPRILPAIAINAETARRPLQNHGKRARCKNMGGCGDKVAWLENQETETHMPSKTAPLGHPGGNGPFIASRGPCKPTAVEVRSDI